MKFIEPSVTLLKKPEDQTNEAEVLKYIERIGRVCYRSEDKITEDSAKKFFLMLKNRGHWAMLEHFILTVYMDEETYLSVFPEPDKLRFINSLKREVVRDIAFPVNPKLGDKAERDREELINSIPLFKAHKEGYVYRVSFSPRAYYEYYKYKDQIVKENTWTLKHGFWEVDVNRYVDAFLQIYDRFHYALKNTWPTIFGDIECPKTYDDVEEHIYIPNSEKFCDWSWASLEFITSRSIANEMVRHRIASYAQESTRYCNYSKDKFGNELTFIKQEFPELTPYDEFIHFDDILRNIEKSYMYMVGHGVSPQIAREILPNCLSTKIVMTASYDEWSHVFSLRCSPEAHPSIRSLMTKARELIQTHIPLGPESE